MLFFRKPQHEEAPDSEPVFVVDEHAIIAIDDNAEIALQPGDLIWNIRLETFAEVREVVAYPFQVYDSDGLFIGFGDEVGVASLLVDLEWQNGDTAAAYWLVQDCVNFDAYLSDLAQMVAFEEAA